MFSKLHNNGLCYIQTKNWNRKKKLGQGTKKIVLIVYLNPIC